MILLVSSPPGFLRDPPLRLIYSRPMGVYDDYILPRLTHFGLSTKDVAEQRARALEAVEGAVLELGIGSGLNLPHYGKNVRRVVGIDPSKTAARMAKGAID